MEKFLNFWSHNNAVIIETLVALILISTLYLAYRTFFGAKHSESVDGAGASAGGGVPTVTVNTAHIEKTLQKILDQQSQIKIAAAVAPEGAAGASSAGAGAPVEMVAELQSLKKALEDKEKQITVLQREASQAASAANAADAGPSAEALAAAATAAAGLAEKERADYEGKIKDLEARLAEYEIISEDIADLSFYKEENARLSQELAALKAGGGGAGSAPASSAPAASESAPASSTPAPAAAAPAAAPAAAIPDASPEAMSAIDDSLMAEFAAAVEGQKSGTLEPAPAAAAAPAADDNSKLLEEFENFNKKS